MLSTYLTAKLKPGYGLVLRLTKSMSWAFEFAWLVVYEFFPGLFLRSVHIESRP
jgi:hypothetical protein